MFTYLMFVGHYIAGFVNEFMNFMIYEFMFYLFYTRFSVKELMTLQEQIVCGKQSIIEGDVNPGIEEIEQEETIL